MKETLRDVLMREGTGYTKKAPKEIIIEKKKPLQRLAPQK